jgi:hypothetical protein
VPEAGRSISETHIRTGVEKLASEELFEQKETNPARSQDRD